MRSKAKRSVTKTKPETVLVLRMCRSDMSSHGGFIWPKSGPIEAPDFKPLAECGNGLHGWLWGEGDVTAWSWHTSDVALVVEVRKEDLVALDHKVKFPRGEVLFVGALHEAADLIAARAPLDTAVIGRFVTAGNYGTATAGNSGTATAGEGGTATAGYSGTATAGNYGTATAGNYGTATAGDYGTVQISWHDGTRTRIVTGYVGECGIEANVAYRVETENLVRAA